MKRDATSLDEMQQGKPNKERGRPTANPAHQQSVNSSSRANIVNSSMICVYFNADSLLNKRNELKMMIAEENPLVSECGGAQKL